MRKQIINKLYDLEVFISTDDTIAIRQYHVPIDSDGKGDYNQTEQREIVLHPAQVPWLVSRLNSIAGEVPADA